MCVAVGGTINPFAVEYIDATQETAVLLNYSGDPVLVRASVAGRLHSYVRHTCV